MRRFTPLLALSLVLAACGGAANDTASTSANAAEASGQTETTVQPVATTMVDDTMAEPETATTRAPAETTTTTSEAPATTTTSGTSPIENTPFETLAHTPPDVFDSYVSSMSVTMGFDDAVFEITGDGAWADGSFDCSMGMDISGFGFAQSVVATPDAIWFDDGTGYKESTLTGGAADVVASCPASPLFWDDFVNAGLKPIGEAVKFAGRKAIKVDLTEIIDYSGSLGVVPEIQDAVINTMDMWVDAETNAVLGLYTDIAMDPAAMGDLGMPGTGAGDTIVMTMDLHIDRINDPTIKIATPAS